MTIHVQESSDLQEESEDGTGGREETSGVEGVAGTHVWHWALAWVAMKKLESRFFN